MRWDPERIVRRREAGRAFHREGPMEAKDLVWAIAVLTRRTRRIGNIIMLKKVEIARSKLKISGYV